MASSCCLGVPGGVAALRGGSVVSKGILQKDLLVGCNGEAHVFLVASRPSGLCLVEVVFQLSGGVDSPQVWMWQVAPRQWIGVAWRLREFLLIDSVKTSS